MTAAGTRRWKLRFDAGLCPDITVAVRLDEHNASIKDYYLLPAEALATSHLHLGLSNAAHFEAFRFDALDYLVLAWRSNPHTESGMMQTGPEEGHHGAPC
jgi:hypothetical protein